MPLSAPKAKATEIWISKIDIIAKEPLDYEQVLAAQKANTQPKKCESVFDNLLKLS